MSRTAETARRYAGPALFSYGFRPFFLFPSIWGALVVPIWVASLILGDGRVGGAEGLAWHVHEMLFGFVGGVMAGYLLTAVPNWTGRLPVSGWRLIILFGLWCLGRISSLFPGLPLAAALVLDGAFLVVFAGGIWREVLAGKTLRNLPVCLMVSALAAANIGFHLRGYAPYLGSGSERTALALIVGLIALIGGRIVPSFTQNWFVARRIAPAPSPFGRVDKLVLSATGLALAIWVAAPQGALAGLGLVLAGVANLIRLARWRGWKASEPLVWILHIGYFWLALGLGLLGWAVLSPQSAPLSAGVHAVTAGAIGVMILAVMTRASRAHTGRPRIADRATVAIYGAGLAAAIVRVAAPFVPTRMGIFLGVSAVLWTLAYGGFACVYGPMLVLPRRAG